MKASFIMIYFMDDERLFLEKCCCNEERSLHSCKKGKISVLEHTAV